MNTLLANGEVPGLFQGDEYDKLMTLCEAAFPAQNDGRMPDSEEELYKWFTAQVLRNLHVVFTMNPSSEGLKDRAATSPALFNRCVLNWFGDWSDGALFQVGKELTNTIDLDCPTWKAPDSFPSVHTGLPAQPSHREAVINACVYVHQTLHKANARLAKRGSRTMAMSPRHYLDFIHHFVKVYTDKRNYLKEQELYLNFGIKKIAETQLQVTEMKVTLDVKSQELAAKKTEADAKLQEVKKGQQKAKTRKVESQNIQEEVERHAACISEKRQVVSAELAQAEEAVAAGQKAVKGIEKRHLSEVQRMAHPPAIVKLALESISLLLGETSSDWKVVRAVIMRNDFKSIVSKFKTENITDDVLQKMHDKFLCNQDYTFERVNLANVACGPLVNWAIAQVRYADMLKKVKPLRDDLGSLEHQAAENKNKGEEVKNLIAQLERSIASSKEEHAQLISQTQAIERDMEIVQAKVARASAVIETLKIELKDLKFEELVLDVTICDGQEGNQLPDECSFGVTGLKLQGANCKNNQLLLATTIMTDLPTTLLRWVRVAPGTEVRSTKLSLPVYLNSTRTELLFTVDLNIAPGQDQHSFYERGVAVLTSTALN